MCENEQKACKEIGYICLLFLPMKSKNYTLVWQEKVEEGSYAILDNK